VQFLHKSVVDFLNIPKVQWCISERLFGKAFNANVQLMGAYLLELKHIQFQDGVKREFWFDYVRPLIPNFMTYAQAVETDLFKPQVGLVDELDRFAGELWDLVEFKSDKEWILHWSKAR
jgi:hypothetical protein